jgi:hypothetical protein
MGLLLLLGAVIMHNRRLPLRSLVKDDVIMAKVAVSSIRHCLFSVSAPEGAIPSQAEIDRCVIPTAKENKQTIDTAYKWYVNTAPQVWVPDHWDANEWLIAICDPVTGDPYFLVGKSAIAEVSKGITREEAKRIVIGWTSLKP